ncbi:MAG: tRNA 2-thiouridine(34) synthase MnmA [Clostridiaceae bacterium]|nr:tRNA 2-thiouridine(34) synthase MnmA [Clostridiaceae bacterium]
MSVSRNKKVLLGLSGGVDSAVAAALLQEEGFEVIGLTLVFSCRSEEARDNMINDAKSLAADLGIEHFIHEATAEFAEKIMTPFVNAWRRGETPNPCVLCNPLMKFPSMLKLADEHGCDFIATGHYAGIGDQEGRSIPLQERRRDQQVTLLRGSDSKKDQSYFLYALSQEILSRLLFPLGELTKAEVRLLAADRGLKLAQKADSQEICFLPDDDRIGFLREQKALGDPGPYLDTEGNPIGQHAGIGRYTVGQRKKLGQSFGKRMTVLKIDAGKNAIVLGDETECRSSSILLVNLLMTDLLEKMFAGQDRVAALVQLRSQGQALPCTIELIEEGSRAVIRFADPQRLAAPGQAAVFYLGKMVIGGAQVFSSTAD